MNESQKAEMLKEIEHYKKLQSITVADEFNELVKVLVKTVADKMIYAFTSDSVKSIEDFYRIRGEVIARLQPIQEIAGAGAVAEQLEQSLKEYYSQT